METTFKTALNRVKADENLKNKTLEYILKADSNVVSIHTLTPSKTKPVRIKRLVAATCAAAVLCALPIGAYAYYKTPTAYVSVDINPSVELGINSFGRVVSCKAYDADGGTVLSGLSLMNANVEHAVSLIVTSASQNGFINADGSTCIAVTAETNNTGKAEALKKDAQAGAQDAVKSAAHEAIIETDNIALTKRADAIALGITPGKLNLIRKLQALDPTIKTEDYKDATVSQIQKKYAELKKNQSDPNSAEKSNTDNAKSSAASNVPSAVPSAVPTTGEVSGNNESKPNMHSNNSVQGNNQNTPVTAPASLPGKHSDTSHQNDNAASDNKQQASTSHTARGSDHAHDNHNGKNNH
jgi:hypothetical protein